MAHERIRRFFAATRLGRGAKVALGLALLLVAFIALFDWNWLRRPLVSYLMEKSGREIRLDDLRVELGLVPTIHLRGVHIQNAPWAGDQPFATAGEASFTVSLKSLWEGRPVISRLVLIDANVDMQRQADGLRNWRLKDPEDRSPGRVTVHTLEAHRTTIRFVNRGTDLHFLGVATPLEKVTEDGLSTRITFEGSYQGAPYAGVALNAGVLSFRRSGITFPLRGHMTSRGTRVEVDGLFSDVFDIGTFDAKVRVTGLSLSELHPFLRIRPPPSRRFNIETQLTQTHDVYEFTQLRAKIGTTDLAGEATYDRSGERPRLRATLRSESADVTDLRALVGVRPSSQDGRRASAEEADADQPKKKSDGRVLPARPFRVDRLKTLDASLRFEAKKLNAAAMPMLDSLRLAAELSGGVLELKPLDLGIGGGHVVGAITFDARQQPPLSRARFELRDLRLERLVPALARNADSAGAIRGDVSLAGQGNSIAAILGNATGSFAARIEDGRISNLADAKLGLNFGKVFALMLRGDRNIAINCGAIAFDVRAGSGKSRTVVLDTAQTHTTGVGTLDLKEERWDLLLSPEPKKPGLLTRHASIRVDGSFRDARTSIEERVELGRAGRPEGSQSERSAAGSACTSAKR